MESDGVDMLCQQEANQRTHSFVIRGKEAARRGGLMDEMSQLQTTQTLIGSCGRLWFYN